MAYKFKVGDKVMIGPKFEYPHSKKNPHNTEGTVKELCKGDGYPYIVKWKNGEANDYQGRDLVLASGAPTPTPKKKKVKVHTTSYK